MLTSLERETASNTLIGVHGIEPGRHWISGEQPRDSNPRGFEAARINQGRRPPLIAVQDLGNKANYFFARCDEQHR